MPAFLSIRLMLLALLAVLAGCASRPQMTRDEYLAMTTRTYPGLTVDQLARVVQATLDFSLPGQLNYTHTDAGMQAVNTNPFGAGAWSLQMTNTPAGVRLQVALAAPGGATPVPVFGAGGAVALGVAPSGMAPMPGTASYAMFWSRLEFMLGLQPDWMTCSAANEQLLTGKIWGPTFMWCGSRLMDPVPEGPVVRLRASN